MPDPKPLTWTEIQKWIESNGDDKDFITYLSAQAQTWVKSDDGKTFLISDDGKALYKSETDRVASKAIDTFRANTMPGLIKVETDKIRAEVNPKESPLEKKVRELEEEQLDLKKQSKHDRLSKVATQLISSLKFQSLVPLSDLFIGEDEEATNSNIKKLETGIQEIVDAAIKEKLPERDPERKNVEGDPDFKDPFSDEHWNVTEQMKLFTENRELYDSLKKKAVERGKIKY